MIVKTTHTIPSLSGETPRRCYVYLPVQYDAQPDRRFEVLYLFDGQTVFFDQDAAFGKSLQLGSWLDLHRVPLIVVAIECDPVGHGRLEEYSPFDFTAEGFGSFHGRGKQYMDWMLQTLKPAVDSTYRTLPDRDHTVIGGCSMGGLMALYAAVAYNKYFSRAVSLSPSLWINPQASARMLQTARMGRPTTVYMDYGSKELTNHPQNAAILPEAVRLLLEKNVFLTFRIVPGGTHSEASWAKQIPLFMQALNLHGEDE